MRMWSVVTLVTLALVVAGCDSIGRPGGAAGLIPDVPNTEQVTGQSIIEHITSLAEGSTLLAGQPQIALALEYAQGVLDCYQDLGAVAVRTYVDKSDPLSAGIVAVVDRQALTDPGNFVKCLTGQGVSAAGAVSVCAKSYSLRKDDTDFDIVYVGTTQAMCEAFCSRLEGCSAAP